MPSPPTHNLAIYPASLPAHHITAPPPPPANQASWAHAAQPAPLLYFAAAAGEEGIGLALGGSGAAAATPFPRDHDVAAGVGRQACDAESSRREAEALALQEEYRLWRTPSKTGDPDPRRADESRGGSGGGGEDGFFNPYKNESRGSTANTALLAKFLGLWALGCRWTDKKKL